MNIRHIRMHQVEIPLKINFAQSNNSASVSKSLIFELETDSGIKGYGECCPRPYVTGETTQSVKNDLHYLNVFFKGREIQSIEDIRQLVCEELYKDVGLATLCGLELSLLDAYLKENQTTLIQELDLQTPRCLEYSGVFPLVNLPIFEKLLQRFSFLQFKQVKFKIGADIHDILKKVELIRKYYPFDIPIRLDANCSWEPSHAYINIPLLLEAGVEVIEQIFPQGREADITKITEQFGEKACLMADESLTTFESAQQIIQNKSYNRFNLKLSKNGGIFNSMRIHELAKKNNIPCQLGAHFGETSILTCAGMLFASMAPDLLALEGAFGGILLERDICAQPIQFDRKGQIINYEKHLQPIGLGVDVDLTFLNAVSAHS